MGGLHRGVVWKEDVNSVVGGLYIGDGDGAMDVLVNWIGFEKVARCSGVCYKWFTFRWG